MPTKKLVWPDANEDPATFAQLVLANTYIPTKAAEVITGFDRTKQRQFREHFFQTLYDMGCTAGLKTSDPTGANVRAVWQEVEKDEIWRSGFSMQYRFPAGTRKPDWTTHFDVLQIHFKDRLVAWAFPVWLRKRVASGEDDQTAPPDALGDAYEGPSPAISPGPSAAEDQSAREEESVTIKKEDPGSRQTSPVTGNPFGLAEQRSARPASSLRRRLENEDAFDPAERLLTASASSNRGTVEGNGEEEDLELEAKRLRLKRKHLTDMYEQEMAELELQHKMKLRQSRMD